MIKNTHNNLLATVSSRLSRCASASSLSPAHKKRHNVYKQIKGLHRPLVLLHWLLRQLNSWTASTRGITVRGPTWSTVRANSSWIWDSWSLFQQSEGHRLKHSFIYSFNHINTTIRAHWSSGWNGWKVSDSFHLNKIFDSFMRRCFDVQQSFSVNVIKMNHNQCN